jgi:hypothetical protein
MTQPLTQQRQRELLGAAVSYSSGIGVMTPPEIDSHIQDVGLHRRVFTKSVTIASPTASERIMLFRTDKELTLGSVVSIVRGSASPSVTWNVKFALDLTGLEQAAFTGAGNQTTTSTTTGDTDVPDTNPIPEGAWIWLITSDMSGTVDEFTVTLYLQETGVSADGPSVVYGETNTASNVGAGGVGVFKDKSGPDLRFKNINAGSAAVSVTDDTANNEIDIDVVFGTTAGTVAEGDHTHAGGGGDVTGDDVSTTAQNIIAYSDAGGKNITELTGTQGDILYHNGTIWSKLTAGTSGYVLTAQGAGANPGWSPPAVIESVKVGGVYITETAYTAGDLAAALGYGTWAAYGAGRALIGLDSGDTDFDVAGETGGAKTAASSAQTFAGDALGTHQHAAVSAGTPAGSNAAESAHTHSVTAAGSNAAEAAHTHSVTSNVTVNDHGSHTHTYTDVPNHVHVQNVPSSASGGALLTQIDTNASGNAASGTSTANPTGGVATGTTAGPGATLTHTANNPAVTSAAGSSHNHAFTGSGVTSAAGSSHNHAFTGDALGTHQHAAITAGTPSGTNTPGAATSIVQPYIVCYFWKRTA